MITKIATAALYVDDQQKAVEFWTKQVGYVIHREKPMGPQASWIELGPAGAESCLVLYPKSMMEDWAERKPSIVFESNEYRENLRPDARPWRPVHAAAETDALGTIRDLRRSRGELVRLERSSDR
jgi:hypothetical protein